MCTMTREALTRTGRSSGPYTGRPRVGSGHVHTRAPVWMLEHIGELAGVRTKQLREQCQEAGGWRWAVKGNRQVSCADATRDVLRIGLLTLYQQGLRIEGFNPARAMKEARDAGEPW